MKILLLHLSDIHVKDKNTYSTEKMKNKYGHNVYGFKNDKIVNLISPVYKKLGVPQ